MRTPTLVTVAAALLLITGLSGAALADQASEKAAKDMFVTMDTNKDGVLTQQEFTAHHMGDDFAKADKNHDGKVTMDEYVSHGHGGDMHDMPGM